MVTAEREGPIASWQWESQRRRREQRSLETAELPSERKKRGRERARVGESVKRERERVGGGLRERKSRGGCLSLLHSDRRTHSFSPRR